MGLLEDIRSGQILLLPLPRACKALHRSPQTVRRWSKNGWFIEIVYVAGKPNVDAKQFLEFYEQLPRLKYLGANATANQIKKMENARLAKTKNKEAEDYASSL